MRVMHDVDEDSHAEHPLIRIITLGEFAIERLVSTPTLNQDEPPRYVRVARGEWGNRGPAMTLLKILLCRTHRRAPRSELIEAIWPKHEAINATHALDSAASVLRRHVLRTNEARGMLLTLRSNSETILKLPGQHRIWIDADAFLSQVSKAMRVEIQGQNPRPLLEEALTLARGEFLEDDLYAEWAQGHRHTINGARHRALFKLVELYLKGGQTGLAEELLFSALEEDPADEDTLCRLMILLEEQGRRHEALQLYQYTEDVLREEQTEPATYTREVAHRVRQGPTLREQGAGYIPAVAQIPTASEWRKGSRGRKAAAIKGKYYQCVALLISSNRQRLAERQMKDALKNRDSASANFDLEGFSLLPLNMHVQKALTPHSRSLFNDQCCLILEWQEPIFDKVRTKRSCRTTCGGVFDNTRLVRLQHACKNRKSPLLLSWLLKRKNI